MFRTTFSAIFAVLLLSTSGCSQSDSTGAVEEQLAEVTAERDALLDRESAQQQRHDRALATLDEVTAMLNDPESVGSEEDVVDAIARHSTETAVMDDDVFGRVSYRDGFYNTLYGGAVDARIDAYDWWVSEDGSQGGVLWIWYGINKAGNPFELVGLSLQEFSDDGRIVYELVTYPYSDDYVRNAFQVTGRRRPPRAPINSRPSTRLPRYADRPASGHPRRSSPLRCRTEPGKSGRTDSCRGAG